MFQKTSIAIPILLFLLLSACSPSEAAFKSQVPVTPMPFYAQAPDGDWSLPWQEACEEASVVLAYYGATGKHLTLTQFRQDVLEMVAWENEHFGDYKDTDTAQTAQILREYYGYTDFVILDDPTADDLKAQLAQGHLIIAPFAGRELRNPFYSGLGPLYHMLVIKGYDATHFITNDVGTKRGENFIYPYATIMFAMHEWNDENIDSGAKKVIVMH